MFTVSIEVHAESDIVVSNNRVEKFGRPQLQQIHVVFGVIPLKTSNGMFKHLRWYQVSHSELSQAKQSWFDRHGLVQTPHGNLTGPGLG